MAESMKCRSRSTGVLAGKAGHISMAMLVKICEALNCDITDVIESVPDSEQKN